MDLDTDGYGTGCAAGLDCNDGDGAVHTVLSVAVDADGDGVTFGAPVTACTGGMPPPGYALPSATDDCNEANPAVSSGCGTCTTRPFNGRTWAFCSDTRDHGPAQTQCEGRGMHLASLHSEAEAAFVQETLTRLAGVFLSRVWIGLYEGFSETRWDDGSAVDFYDFPGGATAGSSSSERCANIVGTDRWDDDDCGGHTFPYLCATAP